MAIVKERIEAVKRGVDLVALVESRGIALKKNGSGWFGLCPFHDDTNPSLSINPDENLFQCFGCGAAGDVIRFVELFDKVSFTEAVKRLSGSDLDRPPRSRRKKETPPKKPTAAQVKLLRRVIDFYHTAFAEDPRAMQYLERRGITDKAVYSAHKLGFANGTLLNVLPHDGDISGQLKGMGVLADKGHEHFYGYVTFPLYDAGGNPCGIYGRRLDEMVTGNVPDHLQWLAACKVKTVHICFDADETGRKAADKTVARLEGEGFTTRRIDLPEGKDINDFFLLTADAAGRFQALVHPQAPVSGQKVPDTVRVMPMDGGFVMHAADCRYEVRGIVKRGTKLKATVKGVVGKKGAARRMHVDTVDFYSARSRAYLVKAVRCVRERRADGDRRRPAPAGAGGEPQSARLKAASVPKEDERCGPGGGAGLFEKPGPARRVAGRL
jgi:hypothetical protein